MSSINNARAQYANNFGAEHEIKLSVLDLRCKRE